ncbi:MAG TPA: AAA family ATPase [Polyangia bacterium]|jgi:SpoVK/Ycf46/Vps4 family AAA+-type ATPase
MSDVLDAVTPYASTRDHVLDEIALVRARALTSVGGLGVAPGDLPTGASVDAPAPDVLTIARRVALSLASGVELRLPRLESTFGLLPVERAALMVAVAAEFDPLFRSICRGLQGEMAGPSLQVGTIVELTTRALDEAVDAAMLFLPGGKLRQNALITVEDPLFPRDVPLQALRVKIDRRLGLWLLGQSDSSAPAWLERILPRRVLAAARLPDERKADLVAHLGAAREASQRVLLELQGPPGVGKKFVAEGLCAELGQELLVADCRAMLLGPHGIDREILPTRLAEVRREALLVGAAPYLDHYDAILQKHEPARAAHDQESREVQASATFKLPPELLAFARELPVIFFGIEERFEALAEAGPVVRIHVPFPSPAQRAAIWLQTFEQLHAGVDGEVDWTEIGRKLALDAARIQSAARSAVSTASLRAHGAPAMVTRADLLEASRHQLQHDLKSLAVRVDKTYRWEDLVISVDGYHALIEMISYAKNAERVYEDWGFGAKHSVAGGISALFSGPPGTGKTMCAGVIARELDMELFRVDLSRVVSKWIGETEKNLARVFDEAQRSNAVVLFDEADSLFAKRTEVKSSVDRYANLEVNFLLQRMETFNGITVLTTNFEDTIDSAFKRRLTFRIRFEKPDADARGALWEKMFPPTAQLGGDVDFAELGRRFEVSGGNIRNAAIRAAFLAANEDHAIDQETLVRATQREAREMGVLIAEERPPIARDEAADEAAADDNVADAPTTPPTPNPSAPPPRLVPITRRRK